MVSKRLTTCSIPAIVSGSTNTCGAMRSRPETHRRCPVRIKEIEAPSEWPIEYDVGELQLMEELVEGEGLAVHEIGRSGLTKGIGPAMALPAVYDCSFPGGHGQVTG